MYLSILLCPEYDECTQYLGNKLFISHLFTSQNIREWNGGLQGSQSMKSYIFDEAKFSSLGSNPLPFSLCTCRRIQASLIRFANVRKARLNSPASSAHTAPRQTYAAPWHVQRGQTVAKAWYAEPALWWAYPRPAATLVRTRLQEEEMQKEKTGQKKRSHIKTESKEINWKSKSWVFVLLHCCVQQSVQN